MEFKCQICGKVYDNVRDYVKCAERCAAKLEEELEKKNRKETLLTKKEIEIKKIYNDLKKAIDEYYNIGGTKLVKSSLSIGDKPADTCNCNCKKSTYNFDNRWYSATPKWFSIPNDVKIECYNKAEDFFNKGKKDYDSLEKKVNKEAKPKPKFKPKEKEEIFEDIKNILKTALKVDELSKPAYSWGDFNRDILDFPFFDESIDVNEFLRELEENIEKEKWYENKK